MNNLCPTSVCDTTPLQHLETQSSSSSGGEPITPMFNGVVYIGVETTEDESSGSGPGLKFRNGGILIPTTNFNQKSIGNIKTASSTAATTTTTTITQPANESLSGAVTTLQISGNANGSNNNNNKTDIDFNNFVNDKLKMDYNNYNADRKRNYGFICICKKILCDLCILACVILPLLYYQYYGEPYKRGFFCGDESLKHPYKDSTVRSWTLLLVGFALPVALILIVEFYNSHDTDVRPFSQLAMERYSICHLKLPEWFIECYKSICYLVYGASVTKLTTDIAKYSVGRLRPHFLAVCQPEMPDGTTCADASNAGRFIEKFECRGIGVSARMLKDMRLSFPSGHTSFVFFTIIYIVIYLQKRMNWHRSKMFKHLLQFLFLIFAWYTALTRVSDYKHHWTDVLAGSLIGTFYAIAVTSSFW